MRLAAALSCINDIKERCTSAELLEVWCDGSVRDSAGGSGFVIVRDGVEVTSGYTPAGSPSSSLAAEAMATINGINSATPLLPTPPSQADILVVTDSMSLVTSLASDPYRMSPDIIPVFQAVYDLANLTSSVHVVWVSSHCGLFWNDEADRLAAKGTLEPQDHTPLPIHAAKVLIRERTKYPHPLINTKRLDGQTDRRSTTLLNQLSTGHCPRLQSYLAKINVQDSPLCLLCNAEPETADHLLITCPARATHRASLSLQHHSDAVSAIKDSPSQVLRFLQLESIL